MNSKCGLGLVAIFVLLATVQVHSSPLTIWDSLIREIREAPTEGSITESSDPSKATGGPSQNTSSRSRRAAGTESATTVPEAESSSTQNSRPTREATTDEDCPKELQESSCKEDSCPLDDKTVDKCCKCFKSCCSAEGQDSSEQSPSAEPEPSSQPESATASSKNGTTNNIKDKIHETAAKAEGFFKNVGDNIKHGVGNAVDKVKSTASTVKESVRKGINKGADWVKNKTNSQESTSSGGSGTSCKDSKASGLLNLTKKGAVSTTPTNIKAEIIEKNCTVDGVNEQDDNTEASSSEASSEKKSKRNAYASNSSRYNNDMKMRSEATTMSSRSTQGGNSGSTDSSMQSGNSNSTTTKVPGMRKSKRSPAESEDIGKKSDSMTGKGKMESTEKLSSESSSDESSMTTMKTRTRRAAKGAKTTMDPTMDDSSTTGNSVEVTTKSSSSSQEEDGNKNSAKITNKTANSNNGTDTKIFINISVPKNDEILPIRAPGSIDPSQIYSNMRIPTNSKSPYSASTNYNNGGSSSSLSSGSANFQEAEGSLTSGAGIGNSNDNIANSSSFTNIAKPGRCRPLSEGLQCVYLGKDAAQCKNDNGCPGLKKCCFYVCNPNSSVGVCEHPILS